MINFYSIQRPCCHEITIQKSRFIAYLQPITDENEFSQYLQEIKRQHYKATHHCQAYILGQNKHIQKANDDGEPSGTAGYPMMEVLRKNDLTNLMAVVVRYFGGVKLGTGGLIRAYSTAVSEALNYTQIIANVNQDIVLLKLEYRHIDSFNYFHENSQYKFTILSSSYSDIVSYELAINPDQGMQLKQDLMERFHGEIGWQKISTQTINIPLTNL